MKETNGQTSPAEWTCVCDLSIFGSCKSETLNIQLIVENRPQDVAVEGKLAHFSKMLDDQLLTDVYFPPNVRVDGWIATGTEVPAFYDPMLAKLIVQAEREPRRGTHGVLSVERHHQPERHSVCLR